MKDRCKSCGVPWVRHPGIEVACADKFKAIKISSSLLEEVIELKAERSKCAVAMDTLRKIASSKRGGLNKRLAISAVTFIEACDEMKHQPKKARRK